MGNEAPARTPGSQIGRANARSISDIGEIFDGPHATPRRRATGSKYFLNISSLVEGRLDLSRSDRIDDADFAQWTRRVQPREGDLLFSYETRLGSAALMPADLDACLGRRMALLRPDRSVVDPRFLLYAWLAPQFQRTIARRSVSGATVDRIPLTELGNWPLDIPSLAVQRAVAEVLGALDDKIAANRRVSHRIDQLVSRLFSARFDALPTAPLATVANVNRLTITPATTGSLRYLDIAAVGQGDFELPPTSTWEQAPSRARRGVASGDTVWSTVRPNRRSHCLILEDDPLLVASTGLAVLSPRDCGPAFLYEASKHRRFQQFLESVAEGSAYPAVRAAEFANVPVPQADASERADFEDHAGPLRRLQSALRRENRQLAATRDELLPLLMSGRITVKDAERRVEEVV